ncbi:hypothetical protein ASD89_02570 [Caulobacter sp. Root656]|nr:hypothetical protein ASD89_02570 [Caulobacter sp. Root656]
MGLMLKAVTLAMALALTSSAFAQDFPAPFSGLMQSETNRMLMDDLRNRNLGLLDSPRTTGQANGATPANRSAATSSASSVSTRYTASPQVSVRVRKQFADWMATQSNAESGRRVAALLECADPVNSWAQLVASDGLRPGDAADALAGYWVLNWVMANGADSNRAQVLAVREQVRSTIANNPGYARLNEAQRQEFAEVLILNFLIQHAAYVDAMKRGDQAALQRLSDAAVTRFRIEMGVDLRRLQLTDRGMVGR